LTAPEHGVGFDVKTIETMSYTKYDNTIRNTQVKEEKEEAKTASVTKITDANPDIPEKNLSAQRQLEQIYSMRSWKLIKKYRNFMDNSKCGRLLRKLVVNIRWR